MALDRHSRIALREMTSPHGNRMHRTARHLIAASVQDVVRKATTDQKTIDQVVEETESAAADLMSQTAVALEPHRKSSHWTPLARRSLAGIMHKAGVPVEKVTEALKNVTAGQDVPFHKEGEWGWQGLQYSGNDPDVAKAIASIKQVTLKDLERYQGDHLALPTTQKEPAGLLGSVFQWLEKNLLSPGQQKPSVSSMTDEELRAKLTTNTFTQEDLRHSDVQKIRDAHMSGQFSTFDELKALRQEVKERDRAFQSTNSVERVFNGIAQKFGVGGVDILPGENVSQYIQKLIDALEKNTDATDPEKQKNKPAANQRPWWQRIGRKGLAYGLRQAPKLTRAAQAILPKSVMRGAQRLGGWAGARIAPMFGASATSGAAMGVALGPIAALAGVAIGLYHGFKALISASFDARDAILKLADRVGKYSAPLAAANAQLRIGRLMRDIELAQFAGRHGAADTVNRQNEYEQAWAWADRMQSALQADLSRLGLSIGTWIGKAGRGVLDSALVPVLDMLSHTPIIGENIKGLRDQITDAINDKDKRGLGATPTAIWHAEQVFGDKVQRKPNGIPKPLHLPRVKGGGL